MHGLGDSMRCFSHWVEDVSKNAPITPFNRRRTNKNAKPQGGKSGTRVEGLGDEDLSTSIKMRGTTPSPGDAQSSARPCIVLGIQNPYLRSPIALENNVWKRDEEKGRATMAATQSISPSKPDTSTGSAADSTTPEGSPKHARNISNASTLVDDELDKTPTKDIKDSVHIEKLQAQVKTLTAQLAVSEGAQTLSQEKIASLLAQLTISEKAITKSQDLIRGQEVLIQSAEKAASERRFVIGNLQRETQNRDAEIKALRGKRDIRELSTFYESQHAAVANQIESKYSDELAALKAENAALKKQNDRARQCEEENASKFDELQAQARRDAQRVEKANALVDRVHALGEEQYHRAEALVERLEEVTAEGRRCSDAAKDWRRRCEFVHAEGEKEHARAQHWQRQYWDVLTKARARGIHIDEEAGRDGSAAHRVVDSVAGRINSRLRDIVDEVRGGGKAVDDTSLAVSVLQDPSAAIFEPLDLDMQTNAEVETERQRVLEAGMGYVKKRARHMKLMGTEATESQVTLAMELDEEISWRDQRLRGGLFF